MPDLLQMNAYLKLVFTIFQRMPVRLYLNAFFNALHIDTGLHFLRGKEINLIGNQSQCSSNLTLLRGDANFLLSVLLAALHYCKLIFGSEEK